MTCILAGTLCATSAQFRIIFDHISRWGPHTLWFVIPHHCPHAPRTADTDLAYLAGTGPI